MGLITSRIAVVVATMQLAATAGLQKERPEIKNVLRLPLLAMSEKAADNPCTAPPPLGR
jgi:hypothetical protein